MPGPPRDQRYYTHPDKSVTIPYKSPRVSRNVAPETCPTTQRACLECAASPDIQIQGGTHHKMSSLLLKYFHLSLDLSLALAPDDILRVRLHVHMRNAQQQSSFSDSGQHTY